jgi:hypothetical protein
LATQAAAQAVTVTSNGSSTLPIVVAWDDYAKRTFGDAWDMNERTDLGWLTWSEDQPDSGMTGKTVVDGRFRGTPVGAGPNFFSDPNFFLLDSWFSGASKLGKNGGQYPIDASRYTMLVLKMKMEATVLAQGGVVDGGGTVRTFAELGNQIPVFNVFWSRDSISFHPSLTPNGGSIGLAALCGTDIDCGGQVPDGTPVEVGIAFSPGGDPIAKSMEGGRYVLHTLDLADLVSTSSYTHIRQRTDGRRWINFGGPNSPAGWTGSVDSVRIDPINLVSLGEIDLDFARLLAPDPANSVPMIISWSGGAYPQYDIVLSTDPSCDDDAATPGAQYSVVAYNQPSGFAFLPQTLPPGDYYVGLRDPLCGVASACATGFVGLANSAVRACASSPIRVVDAPSLTFTSPRPEGSADDFATTQLGNPWDFSTLSDVDLAAGLSGATVGTIPAERPSGVSLGNVQAYSATSTPAVELSGNVGDPLIYPFYLNGRGAWNRIDTDRYRLLTFDIGVDRARNLNTGSIGRIVWHVAGEGSQNPIFPLNTVTFGPSQNVSSDILLRHMAKGSVTADTVSARHVIDRFQVDLRDHVMLPLESDLNGSQSRTGWFNPCTIGSGTTSPVTGLGGGLVSSCGETTMVSDPFGLSRTGLAAFRVDPHEFSAPTTFHIAGIRLAAHERIGGSFELSWTAINPNPAGTPHATDANWTVRLYAVPTSPASPMSPVSRTCAAPTSAVIGDYALSAGTATWSNGQFAAAPSSGTITAGALVFVCAGLIPPGGTAPSEFALSQWPVVYDTSAQTLGPRLFLDKSSLHFTAVRTATTLTAVTPAQTVTVSQVGTGSVPWTVDVRDTNGLAVDYVQITPASGTGAGTFSVSVVPSNQLPHGFSGQSAAIGLVIRLTAAGAENSPQYVNMTLVLYRDGTIATAPAFGQVDTPVSYTGTATNSDASPCAAASGTPTPSDDCVSGSIAVTGWALDDIGVSEVQIFRQCTALEAASQPSPCQVVEGRSAVYVGNASFISGARPDVEAAFASYPNAHRAGWGFLVLSNMLPDISAGQAAGGQGVFDFYVFALDAEGRRTLLGRTTADATPTRIYANNAAAAAPFGAIDFPAQGEVISGTYNNFGWALTPHSGGGAEMATNGAGITVFVDGSPVGTPTYNLCRGSVAVNGAVPPGQLCNDDISMLFRDGGYRNLQPGRGAIGLLSFNTAGLTNGLHSIAWGVTDSLGRSSGIGSRFITVLNSAGDPFGRATVGQEVGLREDDLRWLAEVPGAAAARTGYDQGSQPAAVVGHGLVTVEPTDRMELGLPMPAGDAAWDGYLVRNGRLLPLPPGTRLDSATGRFTWQAVPGWLGTHRLMFVRQNANGSRERLAVSVSFGDIVVAPAGPAPHDDRH